MSTTAQFVNISSFKNEPWISSKVMVLAELCVVFQSVYAIDTSVPS